jgi:hypothetical protein
MYLGQKIKASRLKKDKISYSFYVNTGFLGHFSTSFAVMFKNYYPGGKFHA